MFILWRENSGISSSLLLRNFWSLTVGLILASTFVFDRRSLTFLRNVSFNAFAMSLGEVTDLPLYLIIQGVLLNDLFEVFK